MAAPKTHKRTVRSFFDNDPNWQGRIYTDREDRFARAIARRKFYALQMLKRAIGSNKGRVLDIGCGSGLYSEELYYEQFEIYSMDFSQAMIQSSRERLHRRAEILCGDIEEIPFKDSLFDVVLCIGVLGYLFDDSQALREIQRVLKPTGLLLVNVENMMSLSNIDYVLRRRVSGFARRLLFSQQRKGGQSVSMVSPWVLREASRGYRYKLYHPWKFEKMMAHSGFGLIDAMTFGFEFRMIRKYKLLPERFLERIEITLEDLLRSFRLPYVSYSGEAYTALYKKISWV